MRFKIINNDYFKLCLIIALLLLISYDSYWFGTSGLAVFTLVRNIFLIFFPILLFVNNKQKILRKNGEIFLFVLVLVILSSIINGNGIGAISLIISGMMLGVVFVQKYSYSKFFAAFTDVVLLIAAYSFFIWSLVGLHLILVAPISNIADAEMASSYGCIFFPILGGTVYRNSSFFREPGVYMILLNTSLIFELFILNNKHRAIRIGVLIVSLLSTISTAAIIILCVILLIYCYKLKVGILSWIILVLVVSSVLSLEMLIGDYISEMFGKFETMKEYGSGFARYSSVVVPFKIFLSNPFFGCGFTQFPVEYEKIGYELFHRYIDSKGLATNTFLNIFAIFGGGVGSFMIYGLYKFCKLLSYGNKVYTLLFCIIFFMMFSNESMPYFSFLYIFFYYGFNRRAFIVTHEK